MAFASYGAAPDKRLTLLCGHYGSGKTNVAVNLALMLREKYETVVLADLDIVNPYFRAEDSREKLAQAGIELVCSAYANSNVDLPALPQEIYRLTDDRSLRAVLDIGGDDRGALALGRLVPAIRAENDYEMLMVINRFRPLTRDAESTLDIMREIEEACKLPFTGLVNDSNLGAETTAETVLSSQEYAQRVSALTGLPVRYNACARELAKELEGRVENLLPLDLQPRM